jgi:hypothetical protein
MVDLEKQKLWKQRIEAYEASGWSGSRWCKERGIPEHQLSYWKKKFGTKPTTTEETATWIPVTLDEPDTPSLKIRVGTVEIEVKTGYDEKLLQQVVRTLVTVC